MYSGSRWKIIKRDLNVNICKLVSVIDRLQDDTNHENQLGFVC